MNYTILVREKVSPKTISSPGAGDTVRTILNPGPPPVYPSNSSVTYRNPDFDIYSDDPTKRIELLLDPAGVATLTQVYASFPGYVNTLMDTVRAECQKHILAVYPVWYQSNVALGIYGTPVADKLRDDIAAVITESNRCEQLIYNGQAYTLNLPTIGG